MYDNSKDHIDDFLENSLEYFDKNYGTLKQMSFFS